MSVLASWIGGDFIKSICESSTLLLYWCEHRLIDMTYTIDFFVKDGNSAVFKVSPVSVSIREPQRLTLSRYQAAACFQLSVDVLLCIQTYYYRAQTQRDLESEEVGRGEEEEI